MHKAIVVLKDLKEIHNTSKKKTSGREFGLHAEDVGLNSTNCKNQTNKKASNSQLSRI